ncbi:MAG: ABC transporter substrate-binding protein [Desulfobulbus propionicus]|nr:MAG: ABC transporter substrate-binding protein [Desulfobulbus propionicus]
MRTYIWLFWGISFFLFPSLGLTVQKLELGIVTKPGSAQYIVADTFKKILEHKSKGTFTVKIYHSASLGNETKILRQLQKGSVHLGVLTVKPFETVAPIVRVINYPFLFKDNQQVDTILDGPLGKELLEALGPRGLKGLAFSESGFRNLTNNRREVKTAQDVKGLKIRVLSSPPHREIWQALGADPTLVPWPIYGALQRGDIDGQENPLWVMDVYNFFEVQKYVTMSRHIYSAHIDVASMIWWKKLSPKTQEMIQKAMHQAAVVQRKKNRKKERQRLQILRSQGMMVQEQPDIHSFREKAADLKHLEFYSTPEVQQLLVKMLEATR